MGGRTFDKVLAALSLGGLILFLYVVTTFVNEINLWIVSLVVVAIAVHDFVATFRSGKVPRPEIDQPTEEQAAARRHPT